MYIVFLVHLTRIIEDIEDALHEVPSDYLLSIDDALHEVPSDYFLSIDDWVLVRRSRED